MAMKRVGIEQARKSLGDLTNEVRFNHKSVILTRNGFPVARLAPMVDRIATIRAHLVQPEGGTWKIEIRTATWMGDEGGWQTDEGVDPIAVVTTDIPSERSVVEARAGCFAVMYVAGWKALGGFEGTETIVLVKRFKPPVGGLTHPNELHRMIDVWFREAAPEAKAFAYDLAVEIANDRDVPRIARQATLITRLLAAARTPITDELVRLFGLNAMEGDGADFVLAKD